MSSESPIVVAASGPFDPLHLGHLRYLQEARKLGDRLVVILNGDSFLVRKKGYFNFNLETRLAIVKELRCVDEVYVFESEDDTVEKALAEIQPDIFAKGGDRSNRETIPEWDFCLMNSIVVVTGVGGTNKTDSSSLLRRVGI